MFIDLLWMQFHLKEDQTLFRECKLTSVNYKLESARTSLHWSTTSSNPRKQAYIGKEQACSREKKVTYHQCSLEVYQCKASYDQYKLTFDVFSLELDQCEFKVAENRLFLCNREL